MSTNSSLTPSLLARRWLTQTSDDQRSVRQLKIIGSVPTWANRCYYRAGGFFSSVFGFSAGLTGILNAESSIATSVSIFSIVIWFAV